ncbi:putative acyl-CoA thioesterase II [Ancylostoma duodenale]|uniref:Putative acyl-CoA thioesterase II n=1 Tax=Ancylostoma duodenale TaxID=51022 RepID=A0A0C2DZ33_9BILA|nr:putative acyl-CoA thioesterase II [Ancylostoma duodenale]
MNSQLTPLVLSQPYLFALTTNMHTAAENARIIDEDGPDLPQRLLDCFLKLERLNDDKFRSIHLLRGRKSFPHIYGGQVVAHTLKSATETVDSSLSPHSMHCYFVKAGAVNEPVDYHVERIRNGRSFATRLVRAMQNNEILFTSQREEESKMEHQCKIDMPKGPDGLQSARDLMKKTLEESKNEDMTTAKLFMAYKLAEFPPTFHRIFEARPVNQNIYKPDLSGPLHNPTYHLWVKPVLNVGSDSLLHQYMAAYISDSTMVETAILPHIARGFFVGMVTLELTPERGCGLVMSTYIGLAGSLLCEDPFSNVATIFIMERDFGRTIFDYVDDDDVLAYKEVELNKPFELGGKEIELDGLEPYIYMRYNCKKYEFNTSRKYTGKRFMSCSFG